MPADFTIKDDTTSKTLGKMIRVRPRSARQEPGPSSTSNLSSLCQGLSAEITLPRWTRPRERATFGELESFAEFCRKASVPYAVFGGVATAAFLGYAHRNFHDIDVVVQREGVGAVQSFLLKRGFSLRPNLTSDSAGFMRLVKRTPAAELQFQLFPEQFILLRAKSRSQALWRYDLTSALARSSERSLYTFDQARSVAINVLAIEDLIASKLWPFFELEMFNDLLLLLLFAVRPEDFNAGYFISRLNESPKSALKSSLKNLRRFTSMLPANPFIRLMSDHTVLESSLRLLENALLEAEATWSPIPNSQSGR